MAACNHPPNSQLPVRYLAGSSALLALHCSVSAPNLAETKPPKSSPVNRFQLVQLVEIA